MAFLALNGLTINVSINDCAEEPLEGITNGTSYNGTARSTEKYRKKRWRCKTAPLLIADARNLVGLLQGAGRNWTFNNTLYDVKGKLLSFSRASTAYKSDGTSVSSNAARHENGPFYSSFATDKSLSIFEGVTPLLTPNQASIETDTTGFTVIGVGTSLSKDGTEHWHGSYCLKCVTPGTVANEGLMVNNTSVTASLPYTAVVYLKGSGTVVLQLNERTAADADVATTSSSPITLTSTWTEYSVTRTFGATGERARIQVAVNGASPAAITWYSDGFDLYQKSHDVGFHLPGSARAAESVFFPSSVINYPNPFTIVTWVNITDVTKRITNTSNRIYQIYLSDNTTNGIILYHNFNTAYWILRTYSNSTTNTSVEIADSYTANGWNMIATVIDPYANSAKVYINGVWRGSINNPVFPGALGTNVYIGSSGTTNFLDTQFGAFMVFPFAWTDTMASSYYALSRPAYGYLPRLEASGDLVNRPTTNPMICKAEVSTNSWMQAESHYQTVEFLLKEA